MQGRTLTPQQVREMQKGFDLSQVKRADELRLEFVIAGTNLAA